jgi:energy-coupling factor transporter ATP-binding protein EcfA2
MVQFFLFEKEDIKFGEITGVFGPNGSGKSALLDAIQIALMGANSKNLALNAQADERGSDRNIRSYCLGQYGEDPEQRARDQATTYITLIWRETETNEPISMGVCIQASSDQETHQVLGRYILPGIELSLGDHLRIVGGAEHPLEWSSFRIQLAERAKAFRHNPFFEDSEKYLRAAMLALRGTKGQPAIEAFVRSFKFGLRMRFTKSVDHIVRNDVLEPRPTKIQKFKEIAESFRKLRNMVSDLETRIKDAETVASEYTNAGSAARKAATWLVLSKMAGIEIANESLENAVKSRVLAEEALAARELESGRIKQKLSARLEEANRLGELLAAHAAHKDYAGLQAAIERSRDLARRKATEIRVNLAFIQRTLQEVLESPDLKAEHSELQRGLIDLEQLVANWHTLDVDEIEASLKIPLQITKTAWESVFEQGSLLQSELSRAERLRDETLAKLQRARAGHAPISREAEALMRELSDHGLRPVPLCQLVRITDPLWQPVVESYLGRNTDALLISEEDELEAFRIYRGMRGSDVYGAKLVMESRHRTARAADTGSVAELVKGDNLAAVTYFRKQFGDLRRAETDAEAMDGRRTLTKDGMLVSNGEIERLRPVRSDLLKIGVPSGQIANSLQVELNRCQDEFDRITRAKEQNASLELRLRNVSNANSVVSSIRATWHEFNGANKECEGNTVVLEGAADEEYVRLGRERVTAVEDERKLSQEHEQLLLAVGNAQREVLSRRESEQGARLRVSEASQLLGTSRQDSDVDREFESRQWDDLLTLFSSRFANMQEHCEEKQSTAVRAMHNAINRGNEKLGAFREKHREPFTEADGSDWRAARNWINRMIARLRGTELVQHKAAMEDAYRTSQETFRNDVAIALNNNLEWLQENLDRLNSVLRGCPSFSNGERYQFKRTVRPQLDRLLRYVKDVATHGPDGDMFGGATDVPPEFQQLLEDKVGTGGAAQPSPLDDYREFFEFDVEILREQTGTQAPKVVGHLSKRLGSGSGGEHRAPLYVIAGAALASAYRLDIGSADGIRLMLLDEAFMRMDANNIIATMLYLEQLGLQVLLATPGENQGILGAFMDRYYDVVRDSHNNSILIEGRDISVEARQMNRMDLPAFNPDILVEELDALTKSIPPQLAQAAG